MSRLPLEVSFLGWQSQPFLCWQSQPYRGVTPLAGHDGLFGFLELPTLQRSSIEKKHIRIAGLFTDPLNGLWQTGKSDGRS
jgi:hypothetical protein